jgi:hypothetical protein
VIIESDVADELSNQDHEAKYILPTTSNEILLEAPPLLKFQRRVSNWSKRVQNGLTKLESARNYMM